MPQISINNTSYYYHLSGSGEPIILIAGYTRDHTMWAAIKHILNKHFKVLVFDNLGIGQTKHQYDAFTIEQMAKDVIDIADALQLTRPHVIGHSMGGTIAQTIASQFPDKINKLGLLCTTSKWRAAMLRGLNTFLQMRERGIDFDFIFKSNIAWVFGEKILKDSNMIDQLKQATLYNPYPQSLPDQQKQFDVLVNFDGSKNLQNIKAETFIAYGNEDIIALPYESQYLASHIPNAQLMEFNSGHALVVEACDELAQALIEFLK